MPNISALNGRCGSRIADVNGVLKGNIQDVNNVGGFVAYSPPLDIYTGAAAAYSVRLLRTAYTGDIMRVRRASDNVEADVGFDAGELKLTSPISNTSDAQSYTDLADFVDHTGTPTDAFCRYWYDQSGNSNDAGTATQPNQPQIYDATTGLITENGKPALQWDGVNDSLAFSLPAMNTWTQHELFWVNQSSDGVGILLRGGPAFPWLHISQTATTTVITDWLTPPSDYTAFRKDGAAAFASSTTRTQYKAAYYDGVQHLVTVQGAANTSNTTSSFSIGDYSGFEYSGTLQELMMYVTTDQGSNVSNIECNINGFFKIY